MSCVYKVQQVIDFLVTTWKTIVQKAGQMKVSETHLSVSGIVKGLKNMLKKN